jgi:uncharacterized protein YjbJ (UPF0337 family)
MSEHESGGTGGIKKLVEEAKGTMKAAKGAMTGDEQTAKEGRAEQADAYSERVDPEKEA